MKIEEITLRNFRNYREMTLLPHEGVNLFFGANGSGKTNLLEAIHYCALGKSHRVTGDQNVIRMGEDFGVCGVTVVSGGVRRKITVRLVPNDSVKKTITIDNRKIQRFKMGKKNTAVDERYMKMAEDSLYTELSILLDIPREKMVDYISDKIEGH